MKNINHAAETLPASIYSDAPQAIPEIKMEVLRHVDIGERVVCAACTVNGLFAKRLTQESYGIMVGKAPTWMIESRIVSDWFAKILETAYQEQMKGKTVIIHQDQ
jgi:hypothetical protein